MQLLARAEGGEALVLLAELVFEAEQLFAEAFESAAGLGEFGKIGGAAREDLLNGGSFDAKTLGELIEPPTLAVLPGACAGMPATGVASPLDRTANDGLRRCEVDTLPGRLRRKDAGAR